MDTNNDITKETELRSLCFHCKTISDNAQGGTEFHGCLLLRYYISDKRIPDIDMYCLLDT